MNDRDCENCKHHTEKGCDSWDCNFEQRMTRKEAIEWLKAIEKKYIHGGDDGFDAKRKEAISMAIKALEQEPILDKIRDEIDRQEKWLLQAGYTAYNADIAFDAIKSVLAEREETE